MSEEDYKRLKLKVKDLCILMHTESAEQGHDSLTDLMMLSAEDMVDYMKLLVASLSKTKDSQANYKGYQKALQKLEAEVRNHITVRTRQIEEQLKLYLEHIEAKLEKAERQKDQQMKEATDRIQELENDNAELQSLNKQVRGEDLATVKQQLSRAKEYIKDLEKKCLRLETQLSHARSRTDNSNFDSRLEKELEYLRKRYDDKCSEMVGMARKLSSLSALKSRPSYAVKDSQESRDTLPVSSLKSKLKTFRKFNADDLHFTALAVQKKQLERSKSTERLSGRMYRSPSRSKANLSSTIRKHS
jgi:DNA repair exonuclease SbcCD ATPase subunit